MHYLARTGKYATTDIVRERPNHSHFALHFGSELQKNMSWQGTIVKYHVYDDICFDSDCNRTMRETDSTIKDKQIVYVHISRMELDHYRQQYNLNVKICQAKRTTLKQHMQLGCEAMQQYTSLSLKKGAPNETINYTLMI